MPIFHVHRPFQSKEAGPINIQAKRCPCVSFGIWACNIFSMMHPGISPIRCNGTHPPDACPLAHNNDIIISIQQMSKLVVDKG